MLGVGSHSKGFHMTSLDRYMEEHPGEIEMAGICTRHQETAGPVAEKYHTRAYSDMEEMLDKEKPDGFISVTPDAQTRDLAARAVTTGIPLLMEKPLGDNIEEARDIADFTSTSDTRVMVSMNRRFIPGLTAALEWKKDRPIEYVRGSIIRHARKHPIFIWNTAIHPIDTMRIIAGDVKEHTVDVHPVREVNWYFAKFYFECGAVGTLEVITTAGIVDEVYEIYGPDYRIVVYSNGEACCWENKELVFEKKLPEETPLFVRNGSYHEHVEFFSSIREKREPHPTPHECLQTAEICNAIAQKAGMA